MSVIDKNNYAFVNLLCTPTANYEAVIDLSAIN